MKTYFVATGVVKNKDEILILRKSSEDYNYPQATAKAVCYNYM